MTPEPELKEMVTNLNETNLFEFFKGVKETYANDADAREFSTHLHKLRQDISILKLAHPDESMVLQFVIKDNSGNDLVDFWMEFDQNKEVFDVNEGMNSKNFVTYRISDMVTMKSIAEGIIWKIKDILDKNDSKISIILPKKTADLSTKRLCSQILLDLTGVFDKFGTYYWSGPR
jgi:hypothetical protein